MTEQYRSILYDIRWPLLAIAAAIIAGYAIGCWLNPDEERTPAPPDAQVERYDIHNDPLPEPE